MSRGDFGCLTKRVKRDIVVSLVSCLVTLGITLYAVDVRNLRPLLGLDSATHHVGMTTSAKEGAGCAKENQSGPLTPQQLALCPTHACPPAEGCPACAACPAEKSCPPEKVCPACPAASGGDKGSSASGTGADTAPGTEAEAAAPPLPTSPYPLASTVECKLHSDGFELCMYENVCLDATQDYSTVVFLTGEGDPAVPLGSEEGLSDDPARAALQRANRARRRIPPFASADWWHLARAGNGASSKQDLMYSDLPPADPALGHYPRLLPSDAMGMSVKADSVTGGVPASMGGTFDGAVTWVDGFYIGAYDQVVNPWLSHSHITSPLLGLQWLNTSAVMGLPPIDFLFTSVAPAGERSDIYNTPRASPFAREGAAGDWTDLTPDVVFKVAGQHRWSLQMLWYVLKHAKGGANPSIAAESGGIPEFNVPHIDSLQRFIEECVPAVTCLAGGKGNCPALTPFCSELRDSQIASGGLDAGAAYPVLPHEWLTVTNPTAGTRVWYNPATHPFPPHPPPLDLTSRDLKTLKRRVCAKRAVGFGARYNMHGGQAEAEFHRKFGETTLGIEHRHPTDDRGLPPHSVLLVDKCRTCEKKRHIYNREEVEALLTKYDLKFRFVSDEDINSMTLPDQIKLFSSHGLVIAPHGSALVNTMVAPRRSATIELFPYNLFCPVYWKMTLAAGRYHFPLFSKMKGPDLRYNYFKSPDDTPFITRCDAQGLAAEYSCFFEYRWQSIVVPIHEFEATLLTALSLVGQAKQPRNATLDLLHGVPQESWGPPIVDSVDYYKKAAWKVCPPTSECSSPA